MSSLDDKLRALHATICGCRPDSTMKCPIERPLHAAAAIGAELGEAKGRAEAYEDALSIVRQWSGPGELHHVRIIDIIRARAAEKAGKHVASHTAGAGCVFDCPACAAEKAGK